MPSPSRSGAGWTNSPGRLLVAEMGQPPQRGDRVALGLHGRSGRAASQIGLPVDPSRRIRVSPFHSMKSALPGVNMTASVTSENGMDSVPSKRFVVERQVVSPRLAAVDRDPVGLAHEPRCLERASGNRRPAR